MGLFQDQTNSLSEMKRLAALVMDSSRRGEIGSDQWTLAMMAYGLQTCNDTSRTDEVCEVYTCFESCCDVEKRRRCLQQLALFIRQRKGDGWRALLPFALVDSTSSIQRLAAYLVLTLALPTKEERFLGCMALLEGMRLFEQCPDRATPLLEAVLSLSDLRFAPYMTKLEEVFSTEQLSVLLASLSVAPSDFSCKWLIELLQRHPSLAPQVAAVFERMPVHAPLVMDVIVPIPAWAFKNADVQPLHAWDLAEYFLRIKAPLSGLLDAVSLARLESVWQ